MRIDWYSEYIMERGGGREGVTAATSLLPGLWCDRCHFLLSLPAIFEFWNFRKIGEKLVSSPFLDIPPPALALFRHESFARWYGYCRRLFPTSSCTIFTTRTGEGGRGGGGGHSAVAGCLTVAEIISSIIFLLRLQKSLIRGQLPRKLKSLSNCGYWWKFSNHRHPKLFI